MAHTFKGRCTSNTQDTNGYHVATFVGDSGETATIPSKDLTFVVGEVYSVSVDGKIAPKPAPAKAEVDKTSHAGNPAVPKVTVSQHSEPNPPKR